MRAHQFIFESAFADKMKAKYNLSTFFIHEKDNEISLSMIEVPKAQRKQGVGTNVMNALTKYADNQNKRITLVPGQRDDSHGTTSNARLVKFYKRFGFIQNKGRNKDFTVTAGGMYRDPQ